MSQAVARPAANGLVRALVLSLLAAAVPIAGVFLFPESLEDYEALTWLLLLVPAFLWAYQKSWRGIATVLAAGMAVLSITYAVSEFTGGGIPDLMLAVVVVFVLITLGIGLFGERVGRATFDAAAETLALQDLLTGLPNRRHAEMHLDLEFAAAERGRPLAVILFDVDELEAYNAQNGTSAGDGVLKGFATLMRQHTRRMDLAARYGPDEFVSVLGGCNEEGAVIFASRLQERMRAAEHTVTLPTVSAGVGSYRPEMTSPAEVLRAAEEALAAAKQAGRDRVRVYGRALEIADRDTSRVAETEPSSGAQVRFDAPAETGEAIGVGRTAFLMTADPSVHTRLTTFLGQEGFQVVEGTALPDTMVALQSEFDVVFVDIAPQADTVFDLIHEIRSRSPMTRVVGIPRMDSGTMSPEMLTIRVDGHYVSSADEDVLRRQVSELIRERDTLLHTQLRHRQLSDELRAKDREARLALAASEAKYRQVVQTIQEVIFTTDAAGLWSFLNPAWTAITGFNVEESLGRPLFEFLEQEDARNMRAQFQRLMATRTPYLRHEGRWRTRNGTHRWIEMRLQVGYSPSGEIEGTSGVLADVTDRRRAEDALRQSEEYFRSLIENSADMMAVLNADATIRYVSPATERVLGWKPEEWIGADALSRLHPDELTAGRAILNELQDESGGTRTVEARLRHADGSWRQLEVTCRNLLLTRGVEGFVINAHDVTERQRAERALRESEELLLRTQKMDAIGRLAGGVAHDFNNLLTAIQGHSELLLADLDADSPVRPDLHEIRDAAGRATSLTRQLLAFSRRQVMQPRVLDVNSVVHDMEKMFRRVIGEDIQLVTELMPAAGCVRADPAQIEQVLLNLIVNARDAMPRGGRVTVATSRHEVDSVESVEGELAAGSYVELTVRDTGVGMAEAVAAHAFEPFFTTKAPGQGTGLGLSTVYGIVKQSGGHVSLTSKPDAGTEIRVLLPHLEESAEPVKTEPMRAATTRSNGMEVVLLVEDEKAVRDLTLRILKRQGYQVIVASNGREALELLQKETGRIDLLLTDVVMPELNGQDLAERVRAARPGIPVIFMSGYNEEAVLRHGVLAAGTAFIEKPFSPAGLVERIRATLDGQPPPPISE